MMNRNLWLVRIFVFLLLIFCPPSFGQNKCFEELLQFAEDRSSPFTSIEIPQAIQFNSASPTPLIFRFGVCGTCQFEAFIISPRSEYDVKGNLKIIPLSKDRFFETKISQNHIHSWALSCFVFTPKDSPLLASCSIELAEIQTCSSEEWLRQFNSLLAARFALKNNQSPKDAFFSTLNSSKQSSIYNLSNQVFERLTKLNKQENFAKVGEILSSINFTTAYSCPFAIKPLINYDHLDPFIGAIFPCRFDEAIASFQRGYNLESALDKLPNLQIKQLTFREQDIQDCIRVIMNMTGVNYL
jgi:hypothetical protein